MNRTKYIPGDLIKVKKSALLMFADEAYSRWCPLQVKAF